MSSPPRPVMSGNGNNPNAPLRNSRLFRYCAEYTQPTGYETEDLFDDLNYVASAQGV